MHPRVDIPVKAYTLYIGMYVLLLHVCESVREALIILMNVLMLSKPNRSAHPILLTTFEVPRLTLGTTTGEQFAWDQLSLVGVQPNAAFERYCSRIIAVPASKAFGRHSVTFYYS
jgi:hypothetical protein